MSDQERIDDFTVSVVIPTYRRDPEVLHDAINSLVGGSRTPDEILVIDQTPEQARRTRTRKICTSYDVVHYVHLEETGLPNARNVGWQRASGEVIVYCDDDVVVREAFLEAHLRNYQYDSIGGVGGRVIQKDLPAGGAERPVGKFRYWDGGFEGNFQSTRRQDIHAAFGCNMSFRRELLKQAGGFSRAYGGTAHLEEAELCMKVRKLGFRIVFDPGACLRHLHVKDGGCRTGEQREWAYWYAHNYLFFFRRHFSLEYLPFFLIERLGKAIDFGIRSGDVLATVWTLQGLLDGYHCFLQRGEEFAVQRTGAPQVSFAEEDIIDQNPCRHEDTGGNKVQGDIIDRKGAH